MNKVQNNIDLLPNTLRHVMNGDYVLRKHIAEGTPYREYELEFELEFGKSKREPACVDLFNNIRRRVHDLALETVYDTNSVLVWQVGSMTTPTNKVCGGMMYFADKRNAIKMALELGTCFQGISCCAEPYRKQDPFHMRQLQDKLQPRYLTIEESNRKDKDGVVFPPVYCGSEMRNNSALGY